MSWFRLSSLIFAFWALWFFCLPGFSNEIAGVGYITSGHAEDWTRLIGLYSLGFAVLLNEAHGSTSADVRRCVARGVIALALPGALLMTYWQIIPDRRWFRLDIINITLLYLVAYGMFTTLRARSARA